MSDQIHGYLSIDNKDRSKETTLTHRVAEIEGGYTRAKVLNQPASFWMIYDKTDYDYGGSSTRVDDKLEDYSSHIRSVQGFNKSDPGIVLFQGYDCNYWLWKAIFW